MIHDRKQANTAALPDNIPEERLPRRSAIEAIKEAVRIEQVASEYGEFRFQGSGRLLGRCVSESHEDKTPSMTVFTETQSFKCFGIGCQLRGDVIDLEELAGRHADTWTATVALSVRYGVELPGRPEKWHGWQSEKARRRQMIRDALADSYQRRWFRVYGTFLADIEDEGEYEREAALFFERLRTVAVGAAIHRLRR
jgi:DNA primase